MLKRMKLSDIFTALSPNWTPARLGNVSQTKYGIDHDTIAHPLFL